MSSVSVDLSVPQLNFLNMRNKFKAFVAGYGTGKTMVGCFGLGKHFYEFPGVNAGYFAPTYTQIRDIFYPTIEEALYLMGLRARVKLGDHEVEVFHGKKRMGKILCRSMEDPGSIIGFKIGHALTDEIDVLKKEKALNAWRRILARMRYKIDGLRNGVDVTTTPEGFRFVYDEFYSKPMKDKTRAENYGLVQASTYDNAANLPDDYISTLLESYPENLIAAYINGQFINLLTGTVYSSFDRLLNSCHDVEQDGEPLFIGMDFNVGKMAAIAHVKREGEPRAVDEIVNGYDTPDMIKKIKERYWRYENGDFVKTRQIRIYPDASGDSRKSVNASKTDIALLREAGFIVSAPKANPPVKDRINSMNGMFCNSKGERKYKVNTDRCPTYADAIEHQPWGKNGEPDKKTDHDHYVDAGGYFINRDYPIIKPITSCKINFTM